MLKSVFNIPGMDCPSEENIIRMKLSGIGSISHLDFDIEGRTLVVYHTDDIAEVDETLGSLGFGSRLVSTETSQLPLEGSEDKKDRHLLMAVLLINFAFFIIEAITGYLSSSLGLIADSLDMLADSVVYGLSLLAVSAGVRARKMTAGISGIFQMILAAGGFAEAIKRFMGSSEMPEFYMMIGISGLALIANVASLLILRKSKSEGEHIKASMIFTSNDVIANLGVIVAAILVMILQSAIPDIVIGTFVFALVLRGAFRILKLAV